MEINWSAFDGALGVLLLIVLIWVGLKLMARLLIGAVLVILLLAVFFGWHWAGFGG